MTDYSDFNAALAEAGDQPHKAMVALEALTKNLVGAKLFTIMTADTRAVKTPSAFIPALPDVYPVSGTKPYNETRWSEITPQDKSRPLSPTRSKNIATVFDDHEIIKSLGLGSVINVPIIVDGNVIGTLNCLHETGFYTPERVAAAEALKLPGTICMLLHTQNKAGAH